MKIVFSRKAFDSQYGRVPSPVFPDGTGLPLPIPDRRAPTRFRDVRWGSMSLGPLVECLTKGRVPGEYTCHLDPDLRAGALPRPSGWRPAFGQHAAAQGHLQNQGVGPGDLFLFFGRFRPVESPAGATWRYVRSTPVVHRLFGWLQVSEAVRVGPDPEPTLAVHPWLSAHPHLNGGRWPTNNTIYIASRTLNIDGTETARSGGGVFGGPGDNLTLTAPGKLCSRWRLPAWFWPPGWPPRLSYHSDEARWRRREPWVYVDTVGKGQEFVFDAHGVPEASVWLRELFM